MLHNEGILIENIKKKGNNVLIWGACERNNDILDFFKVFCAPSAHADLNTGDVGAVIFEGIPCSSFEAFSKLTILNYENVVEVEVAGFFIHMDRPDHQGVEIGVFDYIGHRFVTGYKGSAAKDSVYKFGLGFGCGRLCCFWYICGNGSFCCGNFGCCGNRCGDG